MLSALMVFSITTAHPSTLPDTKVARALADEMFPAMSISSVPGLDAMRQAVAAPIRALNPNRSAEIDGVIDRAINDKVSGCTDAVRDALAKRLLVAVPSSPLRNAYTVAQTPEGHAFFKIYRAGIASGQPLEPSIPNMAPRIRDFLLSPAGRLFVSKTTPIMANGDHWIRAACEAGESRAPDRLKEYLAAKNLISATTGQPNNLQPPSDDRVAFLNRQIDATPRYRDPAGWASLQVELANRLTDAGIKDATVGRLYEAVAAYQQALDVRTREADPAGWAVVQAGLGRALGWIGNNEPGVRRLQESVSAYRLALEVQTRESDPQNWTKSQQGLANAIASLGARESGTAHLEEAIRLYQDIFETDSALLDAHDRGSALYRFANAYVSLGQRGSGTSELDHAIKLYDQALSLLSREEYPLDWASAMLNKSQALALKGWRLRDPDVLEAADAAAILGRSAAKQEGFVALTQWGDRMLQLIAGYSARVAAKK